MRTGRGRVLFLEDILQRGLGDTQGMVSLLDLREDLVSLNIHDTISGVDARSGEAYKANNLKSEVSAVTYIHHPVDIPNHPQL